MLFRGLQTSGGIAMLDDATITRLQQHWEDGWNQYDLELIMEPMGEDVVFSSPFVATLTGDAAQTSIHGYDALRSYIEDSLRRTAGIAYSLDRTYVGTESIILMYTVRFPDGSEKTGSDIMRVDGSNKIVEWRCHYPFAPDEVRQFIAD
jgi:hypothetical protein